MESKNKNDKKVGKTTLIENLFSIKESNIEKETSKNKKLLITV